MFKNKSIDDLYSDIFSLAEDYSFKLKAPIDKRVTEMKDDDLSHYLIYRVLGINSVEGEQIDIYQNKGRFLYKYAGSFLEQAVILCFEAKYPNVQKKMRIPNDIGKRPKTFEIDCLIENRAYEIKWRDATTDGDHIVKEHTRILKIKEMGYLPIRLMFYYPNREQSIKIQKTLAALYSHIGGQYYYGDSSWEYIKEKTGFDLLNILERIADLRT